MLSNLINKPTNPYTTITAKIENQTVSYNVYVPYEQLAKVEIFNTKAAINIANNTTNITSWDRESKDAVTTIIDNKHNLNFIYYSQGNLYCVRPSSSRTSFISF